MYYFSEKNYRGNHAGTKARNDVESILKQYGARPINSKPFILRSDIKDLNIYSNVRTRFNLARYFFDAWKVRNQFVVIQYPMLAFDFVQEYFEAIAKRNRLVLLVHDIHSLRIPDEMKLKKEIALLNLAHTVIVHNRFMECKLQSLGLKVANIVSLDIFDYLCECKDIRASWGQRGKKTICFAGNLAKSKFLSDLLKCNPKVQISLFGSGLDNSLLKFKNVRYYGSFHPEDIPEKLKAEYGLVWDGDSVFGCTGALGEYTKINNPHKLSLYLASGIPVIVWGKSAAAEYVRKHGVGIVVERIDNLEEVLNSISEQQYWDMIDKVKLVQSEITAGNQLTGVLKRIESLKEG